MLYNLANRYIDGASCSCGVGVADLALSVTLQKDGLVRFLQECEFRGDPYLAGSALGFTFSTAPELGQLDWPQYRSLLGQNLKWVEESVDRWASTVGHLLQYTGQGTAQLWLKLRCQSQALGTANPGAAMTSTSVVVDLLTPRLEETLVHELTHAVHFALARPVVNGSNSDTLNPTLAWRILTEGLAVSATEYLIPGRDTKATIGLTTTRCANYASLPDLFLRYQSDLDTVITSAHTDAINGRLTVGDFRELYYVGWRVVQHLLGTRGLDYPDIARIPVKAAPTTVKQCLSELQNNISTK